MEDRSKSRKVVSIHWKEEDWGNTSSIRLHFGRDFPQAKTAIRID